MNIVEFEIRVNDLKNKSMSLRDTILRKILEAKKADLKELDLKKLSKEIKYEIISLRKKENLRKEIIENNRWSLISRDLIDENFLNLMNKVSMFYLIYFKMKLILIIGRNTPLFKNLLKDYKIFLENLTKINFSYFKDEFLIKHLFQPTFLIEKFKSFEEDISIGEYIFPDWINFEFIFDYILKLTSFKDILSKNNISICTVYANHNSRTFGFFHPKSPKLILKYHTISTLSFDPLNDKILDLFP